MTDNTTPKYPHILNVDFSHRISDENTVSDEFTGSLRLTGEEISGMIEAMINLFGTKEKSEAGAILAKGMFTKLEAFRSILDDEPKTQPFCDDFIAKIEISIDEINQVNEGLIRLMENNNTPTSESLCLTIYRHLCDLTAILNAYKNQREAA